METLKVILHTNGDDKCLQNVVNYPMGKDQVLKEGFGIDINNSKNAAFQFKAVAKFHNNQDKTPVFHYMTSFTNETAPTPEKAMEAIMVYREYFRDKGIFENEVYEGIPGLLEIIKASGRKIVLATSKPEEFALRILEHFDLLKYFDLVAGASMDEKRNKKGDVISYAMEKGGNMPCILNAANEVVVAAFLRDKIGFLAMSDAMEWAMQTLPFIQNPTYQDYVETDAYVRRMVKEKIAL